MFDVLEAIAGFVGNALQTALHAIDDLGHTLGELLSWMATQAFAIVQKVTEALLAIGKTIGNLLQQAVESGLDVPEQRRPGPRQPREDDRRASSSTCVMRRRASLRDVVRALTEIGKTVADIVNAAIAAVAASVEAVVAAIVARRRHARRPRGVHRDAPRSRSPTGSRRPALAAGAALADLVRAIAAFGFNAIKKIVNAAIELGTQAIDVCRERSPARGESPARTSSRRPCELGKTVVEFVGAVVAFTYKTAARLIDAMIDAGLAVADLLAQAVASGYFFFRKMVNGILRALGPVGDVLDWVLDQAANVARRTLPARRCSRSAS